MEENRLQLKTPFGFTFGQDFVAEDLSELKSNKLFAKGIEQGANSSSYGEDPFYVLKKYPYSEKILLKYFHKFSDAFYGRRVNFKITTSWIVELAKGESVHQHNHRNCQWSAVFYFGDYTNKSCALSFRNPIRESGPFLIDAAHNMHNPMITDISIQPQTNMIIFFPSWILHFSSPNLESTRYSLAFNVMPSDTIGMGDSTYHPRMMIDAKSSKGFG
tara:strand:+ start:311 stop:961 length:651 start_codon:yes stop_codon:yes gene_type:complete